MRNRSDMQRFKIAVIVACVTLSGGCATLDRDPSKQGHDAHKAGFWVQPPAEKDDSPIFGIRIPW